MGRVFQSLPSAEDEMDQELTDEELAGIAGGANVGEAAVPLAK